MMVSDTITEDINVNFHDSAGELQRLVPIMSKLKELQNDIQETLDAITDVADYDDQLQTICLTERKNRFESRLKPINDEGPHASRGRVAPADAPLTSLKGVTHQSNQGNERQVIRNKQNGFLRSELKRSPSMRMASSILESYEFKMLNTKSALQELSENLEQNRLVWHMQLDHQRNRVLKFNVMLSIASLSGLLSSLPAAFLGMNLHSGLEEHEGLLWPVAQTSLGIGAVSYTHLRAHET